MTKTPSMMVPLGTKAPFFTLVDVISNKPISFPNQAVGSVIMFICNHCPYVKHINQELTKLALDYAPRGIQFIAINSNDISAYPEDSPANMVKVAQAEEYPFPYLFDSHQSVAKAYNAACTPDFFIYDKNSCLVYRGQLDDSRPSNDLPVTGKSIRRALDDLLTDKPIDAIQKPSLGCNIKWKN